LEVGEAMAFAGGEVLPLCLSAPAGEEAEYTMIASNVGGTAAAVLQVLLDGEGAFTPIGATNRVHALDRPVSRLTPDEAFHRRLRVDVSRRLEPQLRQGIDSGSFAPSPQLSANQVITFNAASIGGSGCTEPEPRGGRIRYIGQHGVAVADTLNPEEGFTDAEYKEFIDFFGQEVWPLVTENFGEPSDIDGNGKVFVFFTRAVNELIENSAGRGSYVGGFFFNRDLFPVERCQGSNEAE